MSYTAEISRRYPTCFLFVIDQSGSMADPIGSGEGLKKANIVADAINRLLQNLCLACAREEGVRDYFHVGVIGYGAQIGPGFGGNLAGRDLVPLSELANSPIRVENRTKKTSDGAGGLVDQTIKFPVWLEPLAKGGTPMCQALQEAQRVVKGWVDQHPTCFPPVVIHITDGEADKDTDPRVAATAIRAVTSSDGEVLLFNLHVSSHRAIAVTFPSGDAGLPDQYARLLFSMSSLLPASMLAAARLAGYSISEGARGFVFNGHMDDVIKFLEIGTSTATSAR